MVVLDNWAHTLTDRIEMYGLAGPRGSITERTGHRRATSDIA